MSLLELVPAPPRFVVDWAALHEGYDWLRALDDCRQDPFWHGEGDVGTHTRMVLEQLAALPAWRALEAAARQVVFVAAILHDIAKPGCTRREPDGHITTRGHARRGAIVARGLLWRMGIDFALREQMVALVAHHQVPLFLWERDEPERLAITVSQTARCDWLAILSEADARGRTADDQHELLDKVALFGDQCRELKCWQGPWRFSSDHARFCYFRDRRRAALAPAHDDTRSRVIVMSGLPGAGKDHWIKENVADLPMVSLDAIRRARGVSPESNQGRVIQQGRELAKQHLRVGEPFVWNATNVSRELRGQVIQLLADYRAWVEIAYVEADWETLARRNRRRRHPVPAAVIDKLVTKWVVPDLTEAHQVVCTVQRAR